MVSSVPYHLRGSRRLSRRWPAAKRELRAFAAQAEAWSAAEAGRFVLLAPWIMGAGILLWLGLPARPGALILIVCAVLASAGWLWGLRSGRIGLAISSRFLCILIGGMALIALRTALMAAPIVPVGGVTGDLVGKLERLELRESDQRYTVRVERLAGIADEQLPKRVRVVWRGEPPDLVPGDVIRVRVNVSAPPGPVLPGGYDFSRHMYFLGIGGSGFAYEPPQVVQASGQSAWLEKLREQIADRVQARVEGPAGAVTAALITGKRERIPQATVDALRDAGLAHLLAISGLHMGLVCGFVFWSTRYLLTRSERLTLYYPVKKWAAVVALISGAIYLGLSGGAWSAQRAYIMAAVVFGAILFDRVGLSLRNVAVAALIILVWRPEAIASPGFQMSFAAVALLIASYAALEARRGPYQETGRFAGAGRSVGGLFMTSLLAGLATGPFAAYHFGRIATYGLLGNMLAMPIVTVAVMPALVLAMFLMPFGLDGPILVLVGAGLRIVLNIAQWTADLPGAVGHVAQWPTATILLFSAGLVFLTMLRASWRLAGLAVMAVGMLLPPLSPKPDVFLSRDLRNVAVLHEVSGDLTVLHRGRDKFSLEAWLLALGKPPDLSELKSFDNCTDDICWLRDGRVTLVAGREQLNRACAAADVVVLQARAWPADEQTCAAKLIALDANGQHPAVSLTLTSDGVRMKSVDRFSKET